MTPAKAAKDPAGQLAQAKTVLLEGAGHSLMAEKPDDALNALIGFL